MSVRNTTSVEQPANVARGYLHYASDLAQQAAMALDNARLYGEAQRAVRARDDLLAVVSHDLRAPLGGFAIEMRPEPLQPLLEEAMEALRPAAQKRHVRLRLITALDLPDVRCDRVRVLQVLLNLMANALKFSPDGGLVEVRASLQQDAVELSVCDEGPGIAPGDVPRLFDRYWKARTTSVSFSASASRSERVNQTNEQQSEVRRAS